MSTDKKITIRLSGQDGILALVPTTLGFMPTNSFVVVCMAGERNQVGPVVRLDLSDLRSSIGAVAAVAREHAERVLVVIYSDSKIGRKLSAEISAAITTLSMVVEVLDMIIASNDRPAPANAELAAANARHGRQVLASRDALAASVQYQPAAADPADAVRFLDRVRTIQARDQLLAAASTYKELLTDLLAAVRATPNGHPQLPDLAVVLAVSAYRNGDGALAQVSIDRALAQEPKHCLALLLIQFIAAGAMPEELEAACAL